jgi:hypothetical protein
MDSKIIDQTMDNIVWWHHCACKRLNVYSKNLGIKAKEPIFLVIPKATKSVGLYQPPYHRCVYSLPWAILAAEKYRETVIHECVHGYQYQWYPKCQAHGDQFFFMLRMLMGQTNAKRTIKLDYRKAKKLSLFLKVLLDESTMQNLQTRAVAHLQVRTS